MLNIVLHHVFGQTSHCFLSCIYVYFVRCYVSSVCVKKKGLCAVLRIIFIINITAVFTSDCR